ncbi:MAG: hypothetical protein ACKO5K_13020 [Armatimonadota bacterium]
MATSNPQLILGHLTNLCKVVRPGSAQGYVHGYTRQLMVNAPPFLANQFSEDFAEAVKAELLEDDDYRNAFHLGMHADESEFSAWLLGAVLD